MTSRSSFTRRSPSSGSATCSSAIINCAKEKFGIALLGLVVPFLSLVGAFRLGRPTSPWARLFYRSDHKKQRAVARFEGRRTLEPPHVPSMRHVRESLHRGSAGGADGGQAG